MGRKVFNTSVQLTWTYNVEINYIIKTHVFSIIYYCSCPRVMTQVTLCTLSDEEALFHSVPRHDPSDIVYTKRWRSFIPFCAASWPKWHCVHSAMKKLYSILCRVMTQVTLCTLSDEEALFHSVSVNLALGDRTVDRNSKATYTTI